MTIKERIFHSALFELIALVFVVPVSSFLTGYEATTMTTVMVGIALLAMVWNYIFNLGFDALLGADRIKRGLGLRIFHGASFEAGFLIVTIPFLMWQLKEDFWTVLMMDLGIVLFFLIYAIIFNWSYDHVRAMMKTHRAATQ